MITKIMTPGPTQVPGDVLRARSLPCGNPDLDEEFPDEYRDTCRLISRLLDTENETLILSGEGILGLEAACASLTEPGDRVLVLDNGIYGKGFADFVSMYGGTPVLYTRDMRRAFDAAELSEYLAQDHDFKYATLVHCDTPSGMLNPVEELCPLLKKYGILTVVDSVSGMFGNRLSVTEAQIDLLCGGSQKAVSAPPGLTFVTLSEEAKEAMRNRKTPIASFYANLRIFEGYYEKKWFPYTMPGSDIKGLRAAMELIAADGGLYDRHARIAAAARAAITEAGLKLYAENGFSDTVTVFEVPEGTTDSAILAGVLSRGMMLAGSFDVLAGKVIRIGHMGANANDTDMLDMMQALDESFDELGISLKCSLKEAYKTYADISLLT